MIKIALDAFGGDFAPKAQVLGALLAIKKMKDVEITLYGIEDEIKKYVTPNERLKIVNCTQVLSMGEHDPIAAMRTMTDSSLVKSLLSLRNNENDACVTCGPTQCVIPGAHIYVRRMAGFIKPCLCPIIPRVDGKKTLILDCGANLHVEPIHVVQQAQYASVYAKEIYGYENPRVGLMNIGVEEGKGRQFETDCYNALKESGLNFIGFVETKDILDPPCDIMISDGFTTNMCVKTLEGTAKGIGRMLKESLMKGPFGWLGALISLPNLKKFKKAINPDEVAGAMIFGLQHPVIKAHGSSEAYAVYCAIRQARDVVFKNVNEKVQEALKAIDNKE